MSHLHAQVSIPYVTAIPTDVSVNNWSFNAPNGDSSDITQIGTFLQTFYNGIRDYYSPTVDLTLTYVKLYDRGDPEPRTPIFEGNLTLTSGAGVVVLPEEVAVCLSFRGVLESGEPPARRKGRVYLGPLEASVVADDGRSLVSSDFRDDIVTAYEDAWAELTNAGLAHEVWSPTSSDGFPVVQAWIDNAFDTQRSRGRGTTNRTVTNGPW